MPLNTTVDKVNAGDGRNAPPASDADDHAGASGADLTQNPSHSLTVPGRADTVRVLVQNAGGGYDVEIAFPNTTVTYSGDSTTDVDVERSVVATDVTVTIKDTSGGSNTADYDIFVR